MKSVPLTPAISILVGVIILLWPDILAIVIAIYLIATGGIEIAKKM